MFAKIIRSPVLIQALEDELEDAKKKANEKVAEIRQELEKKYEEARQQAERATEALRVNLESSVVCTESLTEYKYAPLSFSLGCEL